MAYNNDSAYANRLLRTLRKVDDMHDPRQVQGQTHGTVWIANLDTTLTRQLDAVGIYGGSCSFDFFLFSWMKNTFLSRYGEDQWPAFAKCYDLGLTPPKAQGARPFFHLSEWQLYLQSCASDLSMPHALMNFAALCLESNHKNRLDDLKRQQAKSAPTCGRKHVEDVKKLTLAPTVQTQCWDYLDKYLEDTWHSQLRSSGFSAFHANVKTPWTFHITNPNILGDIPSVELLLGGACLYLQAMKDGAWTVRVGVPRSLASTYKGDLLKTAWQNGVLQSTWRRHLWRAYALLCGWTIKRDDEGKDISLLEYLKITTTAPGDSETADLLTKNLGVLDRRLRPSGKTTRPSSKK